METPEQVVMDEILEIFPEAEVGSDNDGMMVVYTGLQYCGKNGELLEGRFKDLNAPKRYLVETLIHLNVKFYVEAENDTEAMAKAKRMGQEAYTEAALVDPVDFEEV